MTTACQLRWGSRVEKAWMRLRPREVGREQDLRLHRALQVWLADVPGNSGRTLTIRSPTGFRRTEKHNFGFRSPFGTQVSAAIERLAHISADKHRCRRNSDESHFELAHAVRRVIRAGSIVTKPGFMPRTGFFRSSSTTHSAETQLRRRVAAASSSRRGWRCRRWHIHRGRSCRPSRSLLRVDDRQRFVNREHVRRRPGNVVGAMGEALRLF